MGSLTALTDSTFWVRLLEIVGVNVLLSGDNAVVIALAARSLPRHLRRTAIVLGSIAAILMRVVLTLGAAELLQLPWLRLIGGMLLLWIGIKLLVPDEDEGLAEPGSKGVWGAVRTILLADLVMSLDNVLGVAAAAHGSRPLLIFGLAISVPLIVFGSTLILKIMDRFPAVITLGAALIGWVAGEMLVSDEVVLQQLPALDRSLLENGASAAGAVIVVATGLLLGYRSRNRQEEGIDVDDDPRAP